MGTKFGFKGKSEEGKWFFGSGTTENANGDCFIVESLVDKLGYLTWQQQVRPETVSMRANFVDDNGNPVYEHDIIETNVGRWIVKLGQFNNGETAPNRRLCGNGWYAVDATIEF